MIPHTTHSTSCPYPSRMFRLTEHEVAAEAAEMDLVAHHTGVGRHDRGHGVEGVSK